MEFKDAGTNCARKFSKGSVKADVTIVRPATTKTPTAVTPPTADVITAEVKKSAGAALGNSFVKGKTLADLKSSAPKVTSTAAPAPDNGALRAAGVTAAL